MTEHEWLALAAPYALDALDGEERAAFEAHVVGCVLCQAEVASFRDVAARLAAAAPDASPAPSLRRRVLAVARRPRQLAWLAAAACLAGPPVEASAAPPGGHKKGGPHTQPGTVVFPQHPFARSPRDFFMMEP